jgi:pSer/pThr/pTyr-binding forkhead associated (FHA) protein
MSIQPESDDLDRTDELPQLDIASYEARLAADTLTTTDTWLVDALRKSEAAGEEESSDRATTVVRDTVVGGGADLSLSVDRLRQRIVGLESNLAAARTANGSLTQRFELVESERTELLGRLGQLATENTGLAEQVALGREFVQRLQQQLQELTNQHAARIAGLEAAREGDRTSAEQRRVALEQELHRSAASLAEASEQRAWLERTLEEARALGASRSAQIVEVQHALVEEQSKSNALARHLAAKLADYEIVSAMVAQRNATIAVLERARGDLDEQVECASAQLEALSAQLEEANRRAALSAQFQSEIADRDERLLHLAAESERLTRELQESATARQHVESSLRDTNNRLADEERSRQSLMGELDALRAQLQSLSDERNRWLAAHGEHQQRASELERITQELESVRQDAAVVWRELQTQSTLAGDRQQELITLRQAVEDMQRTRNELQLALDDAGRKIERLQAASSDDTALLNERNTELSAARHELEAQATTLRGLEHSLNARDALIESLRAEIRTVQDERSIVVEQLGKARERVKAMAQQIFHRDNRIATLKADLAVHTEALASIRRDVDRIDTTAEAPPEEQLERSLEPLDHEGEPILLNRRVMTLGRTNENDISIPSKMISRHHARLLIGPNGVIVEDTGSTNGCYVNDHRVKQHVLREGDVLMIGDLKFRLVVRRLEAPGQAGNVIDFRSRGSND